MKLNRRHIAGGACMVGGTVAYLWLMAAEVVPTALELAASLSVPASAPVAWVGLTAAVLVIVFGVDRTFFENALVEPRQSVSYRSRPASNLRHSPERPLPRRSRWQIASPDAAIRAIKR